METLRSRSAAALVSWPVAFGLAAIVVARWSVFGAPGPREVVGSALVVAVPAVLVAALSGRPVAAAGVLLACSPPVIAAAADGRWQGILALLVIALAVWSARRAVSIALVAVAFLGTVMWWRTGFDRGSAPGPSFRDVVGETGAIVRRALASVGTDELLVPLSGGLVWWLGVGLVAGAALLGVRPWQAAWIPGAAVALVLGVWAIRLWHGAVDPVAGTWIVSAGIVLAAVAVDLDRDASRRLSVAVALAATMTWAIAFVRELRADSAGAAGMTVLGAAVAALGLVGRPRVSFVSAPADGARAG